MNKQEALIRIENVTKTFGAYTAINNVSVDIPKGSFTTLLGPSGCGKTTLMRLIAGFDEPDAGNIYIDGTKVNGVPAFRRNTPLVFQEYALFPHMTVFENIAYGLKLNKTPRLEFRPKVDAMLEMFGLVGLDARFPKQLSGGQQQRVAFARALITGQNILLMDEPLSNLDAKMRVEVRTELRELQQRTGITAVFVTHDQDEALSMSDRVAVFNKGQICQVGTPWEIYFRPENEFVADFVGTANFIPAEVIGVEEQDLIVRTAASVLRVQNNGYSVRVDDHVMLVIRPECITISAEPVEESSENESWQGNILKNSFLGRMIRYWIQVGPLCCIVDDSSPSIRGFLQGSVNLTLDKRKIHLLPAER